jgi:hypothetical protein
MENSRGCGKNRENPIASIGFNILFPSVIMSKFDDWLGISPALALVLALAFPVCYGIFALIKDHKWNLFSGVGFFSILITGGIGLLQLPREWIAIKEGGVPMVFFACVMASMLGKHTLLEKFLFDENILNGDLVISRLHTVGQRLTLRRIMVRGTLILALSFLISAVLNFALAEAMVHSESGSAEFTKELGHMVALSYPFIVAPCAIVLYLMLNYVVKGLSALTGLSLDELLNVTDHQREHSPSESYLHTTSSDSDGQ